MKYTPDEVAKLLANRPNQPHYVKALIEKCVKAAVLAEREACAQVCEQRAGTVSMFASMREARTHNDAVKGDAAAIRARSQA